MPPKTRDDLRTQSPWRTTPPWIVAVFLLAVFFVFDSVGFVIDIMDMERQPDQKGDRVKLTMSGKFLPYKRY